MAHTYTPEQVEFIRKVSPGRYTKEIVDLFNKQFGTALTKSQIKSFKANHRIKSNVSRKMANKDDGLFTKEQKDFIKENVKGISNCELTELFNQRFDLSISVKQMKTWKHNHGVSSGLKGSEGISPKNKGTKGIYNVGGNRTSFKKGKRPINYKPVGTERIDRDGYLLVKISDDGPWHHRWRHKHKVLWEKENGPIPPGHVLIFSDTNKQNITLDNLILVTKAQLARLNQNHLISENPEFTRTGIIIANIYAQIGERKKSK